MWASNDKGEYGGRKSYDEKNDIIYAIKIIDENLSLPMWIDYSDVRYTGDGSHFVVIEILNKDNYTESPDTICYVKFERVLFSNGNATVSFTKAVAVEEDDD